MRFLLLLICILMFAAGPCCSAEQEVIKDKIDEFNYTLGHQLGHEILQYQLEFRAQAVWQGIYDAVNNSEPFMTDEQMNLIFQQLLNSPPETSAVSQKPVPEKKVTTEPVVRYRQRGEKYLADVSEKEDVISLPTGVSYRIIKAGEGQQPKASDSVMVNYKAYDIDGKVFDSTSRLGASIPAEFQISKLVPGLKQTLPMMKIGAVWEIFLPTRMAYKDTGPLAGQTVIYEMELLEILPEFR